jgi:metal-sulfur cluster biosynthetic enzyme
LPREIERQVKAIDDVQSAKVEVTFDPPWSVEKMSEQARFELGML